MMLQPTPPSRLTRPLIGRLTPAALLLGAVLVLAAVLYLGNWSAVGDGNLYYTAAVASMRQSWHNFFFAAAEPGGSVSVDKPPLGLWVQTASTLFFGVNGLGVVLPSVLAGLASIALVYRIAKPRCGAGAALFAAAALAVTPVAVAAARNNTADGLLTLALTAAAGMALRAAESGRRRDLLAAALLIGLGFNIKMLQAYLLLPALGALYFFTAPIAWRSRLAHLAGAAVVLFTVSFAWAAVVDLTPADRRPFVGSSSDNTVRDLIIGYNGLGRLFGICRGAAQPATALPAAADGASNPVMPAGGGPGGFGETGQAGPLRVWIAPLSKELSWLLPPALVGLAAAAVDGRRDRRARQTALLWGGWLLTGLVFFSVAGFFHAYYLVMLAPPMAVLTGVGVARLWSLRDRHWWGLAAVGLAAAALLYQFFNAAQFGLPGLWLPILMGGAALIGIGLTAVGRRATGMAVLLGALLIAPAAWALFTTFSPLSQVLPAAWSGPRAAGNVTLQERRVDADLLAYLEAHTQETPYLLAVTSSMQGAPLVLETGRPVLYMGGFSGADEVVDADGMAELVADGRLRYVLLGGGMGGDGPAEATAWVTANCAVVEDVVLTAEAFAPGGVGGPGGRFGPGGPPPYPPNDPRARELLIELLKQLGVPVDETLPMDALLALLAEQGGPGRFPGAPGGPPALYVCGG